MTTVHTRPAGEMPLLDHPSELVWLSPRVAMAGFGEALRVNAGTGPERFGRAAAALAGWVGEVEVVDEVGLPGTGPVAFASFTFDPRTPGSVLVVPEVVLGRTGDTWWITTVGDADPCRLLHPSGTGEGERDRPRFAGASIPDVVWLEAVAEAIARIEAGKVEKVVLARDHAVWSKARFDSRRVLRRLCERFPECFTFLVDGLVGASPELLIRRRGTRITSVALAGSAARSADPAEDERLGDELAASEKNLSEHAMAADSVRRALEGVCERLARDPSPSLMRLANVQHLATRFAGVLADPAPGTLELAARLHPTAAVGGVPPDRSMELIRELEGMDRGRYAGPVGWVDAVGDGELAIALRCAELSGARARLFAGAGIVAGSLPETELEETRLKLAAMLTALE